MQSRDFCSVMVNKKTFEDKIIYSCLLSLDSLFFENSDCCFYLFYSHFSTCYSHTGRAIIFFVLIRLDTISYFCSAWPPSDEAHVIVKSVLDFRRNWQVHLYVSFIRPMQLYLQVCFRQTRAQFVITCKSSDYSATKHNVSFTTAWSTMRINDILTQFSPRCHRNISLRLVGLFGYLLMCLTYVFGCLVKLSSCFFPVLDYALFSRWFSCLYVGKHLAQL